MSSTCASVRPVIASIASPEQGEVGVGVHPVPPGRAAAVAFAVARYSRGVQWRCGSISAPLNMRIESSASAVPDAAAHAEHPAGRWGRI